MFPEKVLPAVIAAALLVGLYALNIVGPALIQKAKLSMQGKRSRIVLPHLLHLDTDNYPNRESRRAISASFMGRRLWTLRTSELGAVTLAQAKLNATDDLDVQVIDEFRKSSFLLDNMPFRDVVNPAGGGDTLTYTYTRLSTQPTAQVRAINAEYVPAEVQKVRSSVELKPFGGAFEIDRVLADIGNPGEVVLQMDQKIKAARALFHDLAINGDSAVDANQFDGLDKILTGTTTEFRPTTVTDWSTSMTEAEAHAAILDINRWLALMDEPPDAILGNSEAILRFQYIAMAAKYLTQTEDAFGRKIESYRGIPLIDLLSKPGSNTPIIPVENRTVNAVAHTNLTDLYAVKFGEDGFHAASRQGKELVQTWLPDFSTPGAVKKGEVELVSAVGLKRSKGAAVFRNIKVLA